MRTSGWAFWKSAIMPEINPSMKKGVPATRTTPVPPRRKLSTISDALRDAVSMAWPCSASARPSGVGWSGRRPFTNSGSPMRFSSVDRVRETAGCDRPSSAAPSVTQPAWITAASWTRCRSSNFITIWYIDPRQNHQCDESAC